MNIEKEFNNRIKTLGLDKKEKEELYAKYVGSINNGFKCAYCDEKMDIEYETELSFTIDHIIPRSKGGDNEIYNLEFVCRNCNFLKGEKDVDWFLTNLDRLKQRKQKRELFTASKNAAKVTEERVRESYRQIFKMRAAR